MRLYLRTTWLPGPTYHDRPHLIAAGVATQPSIIAISSVNGKQSFQTLGAYCGSKAAIDHIARCAAVDLAPHGARAYSQPGVTWERVGRAMVFAPFDRFGRRVYYSLVCDVCAGHENKHKH
jgi:NAD(P)-dependent dehydrogenase (short-subunit alcohol dehydrogenase family)